MSRIWQGKVGLKRISELIKLFILVNLYVSRLSEKNFISLKLRARHFQIFVFRISLVYLLLIMVFTFKMQSNSNLIK